MHPSSRKRRTAPLVLLGLALAGFALAGFALAGCGGATTATEQLTPTRDASPTVYGLQAEAFFQGGEFLQTSGLGTPDGATGFLTGAVDYAGTPIPIQDVGNGKIPLGFAPRGTYINREPSGAVAPGTQVIFGAYLANGIDAASGDLVDLDPSGVTLTTRRPDGSEQIPGFSLPLNFSLNPEGALANAQYRTAPFTLPFGTTGLHSFAVTVTDVRGASNPLGTSTTFFDVVVVTPTDVAIVARILDDAGDPAPGATATITNPVADARAQTTADDNGVVVLFTTPGVQTYTVTIGDAAYTGTIDVSASAGQAVATDAEGAPLAFSPPGPGVGAP